MTHKISFKKIVYFDEQAATDLLLEKNEGELEETAKKAREITGEVEAGVKTNTPKFIEKLFNINLAGNAKGAASSIAQTQIKSTILTEFLKMVNTENNIFFNEICDLEITEDSLAYIRSAGKYLKMFNPKAGANLDPELANILTTINIDAIDKILDQASGYYKMISNNNGKKSIVRLNFEGIRNNYKLTDLTQMTLRIVGIKVGSTDTLDIGIGNELGTSENLENEETHIAYTDIDVIDEDEHDK